MKTMNVPTKKLLILSALIFLLSCKPKEARIIFTGDIIMHIPVKTCAASHNLIDRDKNVSLNNGGFDFLFERIRPALSSSPVVIGNMEFPLSPPFTSQPKIFNCTPDVIAAMKKAGFTMVTIANNHILDQEQAGVIDSIAFLKKYGMEFIGVNTDEKTARSGIVKKTGDIAVGFIGYTGITNYSIPSRPRGYYINWLYHEDKILEDIREIKRRCDYLVMIFHTGTEYAPRPEEKDERAIKKYLEAGVDLAVGHHSHVVQQAEKIITPDGRTCYVFYSLGNFISNQTESVIDDPVNQSSNTQDSIILNLFLHRSRSGAVSARFEALPIHTYNILNSGKKSRDIQTVSIPEEIDRLKKIRLESGELQRLAIDMEIEYLYSRIKVLKTALFSDQKIDKIEFIAEKRE